MHWSGCWSTTTGLVRCKSSQLAVWSCSAFQTLIYHCKGVQQLLWYQAHCTFLACLTPAWKMTFDFLDTQIKHSGNAMWNFWEAGSWLISTVTHFKTGFDWRIGNMLFFFLKNKALTMSWQIAWLVSIQHMRISTNPLAPLPRPFTKKNHTHKKNPTHTWKLEASQYIRSPEDVLLLAQQVQWALERKWKH